jgi:hypothetical protein
VEVECTFLFGASCIACAKASAVIGTFCNATALRAACATSVSSTHSTAALSQPRRNIGAVSYEGTAYFAGGCVTEGPAVEFVCDNASAVVDVFAVAADGGIIARPRLQLSAARGWVAAGAAGGYVVFAGGGTLGSAPHSRRADVLEVAVGSMVAVVEALSVGRWGIGVASAVDAASGGPAVFFTGGKVTIQGYDNAFMTAAVDVFRPPAGFARAPYNLSQARESATAAIVGNGTLVVAGGWAKLGGRYQGSAVCDVIPDAGGRGGGRQRGGRGGGRGGRGSSAFELMSDAYGVGVARVGGLAYVVDNEQLLAVDASGATAEALPLPPRMVGPGGDVTGGGAVPAAHIAQNGATVGPLACYYALSVGRPGELNTSVLCYHTIERRWHELPCSTAHDGGQIVAVGSSLLVAGGFDPTSPSQRTTAAVDVFTLAW